VDASAKRAPRGRLSLRKSTPLAPGRVQTPGPHAPIGVHAQEALRTIAPCAASGYPLGMRRTLRKRLRPRLLGAYALALALVWSARPDVWSFLIGLVVAASGEGLRLWATGYLHKTESLTVAGPYGHVRHPLYLGTLLIGTGFAIMAQTWLGFAVWALFVVGFFGYYMPYKNRIEGARLESAFGDEFRRYAAAVPALVPRVHAYVPLGGHPVDGAHWRGVRFADNNETGVALSVVGGVAAVFVRGLFL